MKPFITLVALTALLAGCRTDEQLSLRYPRRMAGESITSQFLPIATDVPVKGVMEAGKTYYITSDIFVNKGDTLYVEEGVKVIMLGNYTFYVSGVIMSEGTQAQPNLFTVPDSVQKANPQGGAWGGFNCDSADAIIFRWTEISFCGGPDASNEPRYGISCLNERANPVIVHDSWISYTYDDGARFYGTRNISLLRNHFVRNGGPEGEALNLQRGVTGTIAYNVFWSAATNCMKIYTDDVVLNPQTNLLIHNNTFVNTGYRRVQKPGNAILFDRWPRGIIVNNLFVNCRQSLRLTQTIDKDNTVYGYNLFFAALDNATWRTNTLNRFYPPGDFGSPRTTDLMQVDPLFESFDSTYVNAQNVNLAPNTNILRLRAGSPALGAGWAQYNQDMGAYTRDGKGNKH
jgi:hypothetical protein